MYDLISKKITDSFVKYHVINTDDYDIYKYGIENLLALIITVISILLISVISKKFVCTIFYLIGFLGTRSICGGYHAKHHYSCFIGTFSIYLIFLLLYFIFIKSSYLAIFTTAISLISSITIFTFAPIEHKNNPMTDYRKKKNRIMSIVLSVLTLMVLIISLINFKICPYILPFNIGIFLAAITILAAKIENS